MSNDSFTNSYATGCDTVARHHEHVEGDPDVVGDEADVASDEPSVARDEPSAAGDEADVARDEPRAAGDEPSAERIVALLAEGDRLRVAAGLVLGANTMVEIAEAAGLPVNAVRRAVARLMQGGLVERDSHGYRLKEEVLRSSARTTADRRPTPATSDGGQSAAVLRAFVKEGRLLSIPASHSKRLLVLDLIVQDFEIGVRYTERRARDMLLRWHPDYAALRRYLVEDGFLDREGGGGCYWRTGGSVGV